MYTTDYHTIDLPSVHLRHLLPNGIVLEVRAIPRVAKLWVPADSRVSWTHYDFCRSRRDADHNVHMVDTTQHEIRFGFAGPEDLLHRCAEEIMQRWVESEGDRWTAPIRPRTVAAVKRKLEAWR